MTTISVRNPRTGEFDYEFAGASADSVAEAAKRLRAGQPAWQAMSAAERAEVLLAWSDRIQAAGPDIVAALSTDTGRMAIAQVELFGVIGFIQRWASLAPDMLASLANEERETATPGIVARTTGVPYQLVGAIAPWNFPLLLALIDVIPALMAGCAALVKPSEITPRFIPALVATINADPVLASVIEIVRGDAETGQALVSQVDYICFTGSVATGRKVAEAAARAFIPANLELGGKDPLIVLPSADPATAASIALRASVAANGQACQSIERVYVARSIAEPFLDALVAEAKAVRFNYPDITDGHVGPFIFGPQAAKAQAHIDDAVARGARVLAGGKVEVLGGGNYLAPTVLVDVTPDMDVIAQESFGPIIPVTIYDTIDEAVGLANDSVYGLSAAVIGEPDEAGAVAERLDVGAVSINDASLTSAVWDVENCAFKASGMGPSRMGLPGLTRYLRTRAIIRQTGAAAPIAAYAEQGSAG